jgi:hypothetical protein
MKNKLSIISVLMVFYSLCNGQSSGFSGVECANPDFGFLIDTSFYLDGEKAFYCPDVFPLPIIIVDKNKIPIKDTIPKWLVVG